MRILKSYTCTFFLTLLLTVQYSWGNKIHDFVAEGDFENIKQLLKSDSALINLKDEQGNSPLHLACRELHFDVAKYLIENGAEVNALNNAENTALLTVDTRLGEEHTYNFYKLLLKNGANVNAKTNWGNGRGWTVLHLTANKGYSRVVKLLLENGADPNITDVGGYGSVLHVVLNLNFTRNEPSKIVKLLCEHGADVNQEFILGNKVIHLAATKGYANVVNVLANHGADVNAVNNEKHSPIYYASKLGYYQTVKALIDAGADTNSIIETNYGAVTQLSKNINIGEAYIWYLGGNYGSGYAVKTKNQLLIFDKTTVDESSKASLSNGKLNPFELIDHQVTVLITKADWLTGSMIKKPAHPFEIVERLHNVSLFVDSLPFQDNIKNIVIPEHYVVQPNQSYINKDINVHTIPATGRGNGGATGVGYLVEVDGLKIYHAGFHVSRNNAEQMKQYRKELAYLKSFGTVDIAFLNVRGHIRMVYTPYLEMIQELQPKSIYLMGGDGAGKKNYPKCAEFLKQTNVPVYYPGGGIAVGERFHYLQKKN